ncbi:MAG: type IV pilus assembly protein PilM [Gaiellaceae bacterium]
MADDEKPTSIWKKEISFRRKPGEGPADAAAQPGSGSIWKKEISLRKKAQDEETQAEPLVEAPAEPDLDAAIAALQAEPAVAEPVAAAPEPLPVAPPAPAVEHDWLTQPLEQVSEPPAEPVSPVSLVPDVVEPVVEPVVQPVVEPVVEPVVQSVVEPVAESLVEPVVESLVDPVVELPALVLPVVPVAAVPELEPELELDLDLPTAVLPALEVEAAWPEEAEPVAAEPEPEIAPEPAAAAEPKVPFYKKELSLKRERKPKAEKPARKSKAERPAKEAKPPRQKREKKEKAPAGDKVPFYKRDLSFKRAPKEWDAGEGLTEEAPKAKRARPSLPRPSLPSFSGGGGGGGGGGRRVVGLKIGGSQIAAARVHNGDSPELVQAARTSLDHGIVVNGELRDPEALATALKDFFAEHKLPKRGVRLGIANNRIGVRTFEVTGIEDPKQLANAIRFRAQEVLPIPLEEAVLDYQVLAEGVTEDGKPLRRVLLVVAYRELVDRYVYACRKAGLQIVGIDLEAFALLRAVAAPHDPVAGGERGALVAVSVGHDRSTFAVSDGRVCEFTRVLEWGGWALNVSIARALDMAPSEVEILKRALSFAGADQAPDGFTEDQLATAREAARRQLQTFARELVSSLQFYQNQPGSLGIGEIVLTGGTAHLPGLGAELERLIGVPVRVVDPFNRVKVSKKVREREQVGSLAVAVGLGIED